MNRTDSGRARILVLGAGSIGARHARNLVGAGAEVLVADPSPQQAEAVAAEIGAAAVPVDIDHLDLLPSLDGAVIASPTGYHADQAEALLAVAPKLLVEKPLAVDHRAATRLATQADRIAVGFNLRFHDPIRRLLRHVADGDVGEISTIRLWFGSWLPDWRPDVDYRDGYSARADLGGGILLDAIHEIDLLRWLLGDPEPEALRVPGAVVTRRGPLEIDVEDTVHALVDQANGPVAVVSLDYLARRYRRGIEVTGSEATIRLDWARQVIEIEDRIAVRQIEATDAVDDSYRREAEAFLDWVRGGPPLPVDARGGAAANRLVDQIREAAAPAAERP